MPNRSAVILDRLLDRVERASSLDPIADKVAAPGAVLKPGRIKDALSGTPLGHPAHPALVAVPVGAWATAAALDVSGGNSVAARRAVGLGVLSALPAALTGYSDWLETSGAERRVGLVHAAVNDTAVALYAASWLARRRGSQALGVALGAAGAVVVTAGGWLGGHMAYAQGVGVDTTAFQKGPKDWTDAVGVDELADGTPTEATVGGVPIVVVKQGSVIRAMADRCTHRGAPLHEGEVTQGCIVCPWHDSIFSLDDGTVVQGPATRPQPVYEVQVRDGRVQVRRADEQRALRANPAGV